MPWFKGWNRTAIAAHPDYWAVFTDTFACLLKIRAINPN